jgi:hypothetical protein
MTKGKHCVSIIKTKRLIDFYPENLRNTQIHSADKVEMFNVKSDGNYSYKCALEG